MLKKRAMGLETEYGITGGTAESVVNAVDIKTFDHTNFFETNRSILSSLRDPHGHIGGDYSSVDDEIMNGSTSSFRGGYGYKNSNKILPNGARFYVDMGHPEYSTPETTNPRELLASDKAGEIITLKYAKIANQNIKIYKNNSDGHSNSFGGHENYLIKRLKENDFRDKLASAIIPFFITRQIFTGSGKVGIENVTNKITYESVLENQKTAFQKQVDQTYESIEQLGRHFLDVPEFKDVKKNLQRLIEKRKSKGEMQIYQLTQRADFFSEILGLQTTHNRPIINTRDEPHANFDKYMRLHVICADSNLCEYATFLKTGTTKLILDMFEDETLPKFVIDDPVKQFRNVSTDQEREWMIESSKGKQIKATEIQMKYIDAAKKNYYGKDDATDEIIDKWEETIELLDKKNFEALSGRLDWAAKLNIINHFLEKGHLLNDETVKTASLQYHNLDKKEGLYHYLDKNGKIMKIITDEEISHAIKNPPKDTRAYIRSKLLKLDSVVRADWSAFEIEHDKRIYMLEIQEPFLDEKNKEKFDKILDCENQTENLIKKINKIKGIKLEDYYAYFDRKRKNYSYS